MAISRHFKQGTKAPLLWFMNNKNAVVLSLSNQFLNHQKAAKPNQIKPLNLKKKPKNLSPNTVSKDHFVMMEGEKSTLPAETIRIQILMANLQPP